MPRFQATNVPNYYCGPSKMQEQWPLVVDHDMSFWKLVALKVSNWSQSQNIPPLNLTVVVPFVQLIAPLRYAWGQIAGDGFLPRIETTQTWLARLGGGHEAGAGPCMDIVLDRLQARHWLEQLAHQQSIVLADALVEPLVLMATDLVHAAAAVPVKERTNYWQKAEEIAGRTPAGVAGVEAALGPLAVAWAQATEKWATDILFDIAENAHQQGLVVVQAGGDDLLTANLYQEWHEQSRLWLDLDTFANPSSPPVAARPQQGDLFNEEPFKQDDFYQEALERSATDPLQQIAKAHPPQWIIAKDAEEEAELAAAEVIRLLNQGVMPVALCSQDRPIARRVWALLQRERIALADETGWTLSTTRCAALVMGLVNAALPNASPDDVLDAFKGLPPESKFAQGLDALEQHLRTKGIVQWPKKGAPQWENALSQTLDRVNLVLSELYGDDVKTLWEHLHALNQALKTSTAWSVLIADEAGREIMQLLHLHELDSAVEVNEGISVVSDFIPKAQQVQMSYEDFAHWVNGTLESMTFIPVRPLAPQVVLMPLARVMLRPFAAVVIPGCDDTRLTALPSLPGFWSDADRVALGIMNQSLWWSRLQAQWTQALRLPRVVLIWRSAEGSQPLGPATLVQRVLPELPAMVDQREVFQQTPQPTWVPAPKPAEWFAVQRLSASAYKKLRDCPYKFYAEYLLQLNKEDELETELSRRDYGNWLHAVLRQFHLKRTDAYPDADKHADQMLLDACADEHAAELDRASLIPWQARWPALRDAYLRWLRQHEQDGGRFLRAEFAMHYALTDELTLQGRMDRLDEQQGTPILIDYKTERRSRTDARVKERYEEVQLPFYALLAQGKMTYEAGGTIAHADQAQAIYLSLDDREDVAKAFALEDLEELKSLLAQSIVHDTSRLKEGFPAYPLGQSPHCDYCDVKGLCRKAYWTEPLDESQGKENKEQNKEVGL